MTNLDLKFSFCWNFDLEQQNLDICWPKTDQNWLLGRNVDVKTENCDLKTEKVDPKWTFSETES